MLKKKPLFILKIGGSVITDRQSERPRIRISILKQIAVEVAKAYSGSEFNLILIHGAGSFGHPIVLKTGINQGLKEPTQRIGLGETQRLQTILNTSVCRYLLNQGLPVFPLQASASAVMKKGELISMDTQALEGLLLSGMIPVLNGVPAHDIEQGCSILSGDQLASYLFNRLKVQSIFHGTNVKGIYSADPFQNPDAAFISEVNLNAVPDGISGSSVTDVTGGMRKKIEELSAVGAEGQIFDATVAGNVLGVLSGEVGGTEIIKK